MCIDTHIQSTRIKFTYFELYFLFAQKTRSWVDVRELDSAAALLSETQYKIQELSQIFFIQITS